MSDSEPSTRELLKLGVLDHEVRRLVNAVVAEVARDLDIPEKRLWMPSLRMYGRLEVARSRMLVVAVARRFGLTYSSIARELGYCDHSAAARAEEKIRRRTVSEPALARRVCEIARRVAEELEIEMEA